MKICNFSCQLVSPHPMNFDVKHDRKRTLRILLMALMFPLFAYAEEPDPAVKARFSVLYAQFLEAFETNNWKAISKYENEYTKCGFGPGDEGVGCIKRAYASDKHCIDKMLLSLRQGCKITEGTTKVKCLSPPQLADPSIVILGARSSFTYDVKSETISVNYFICAGD